MRLFVAIELGTALVADLCAAIAPLQAEASELAWVGERKLHLTMKFLDETGSERVPLLVGMLDQLARAHEPVEMQVAGIGAFPNFRRARVVWIGVEHEPRLELLHHDLEVAADALGFEIEGRAFRPHITLARVPAPLPEDRIRRLARIARRIDFSASTMVAGLTLFESTLAPAGAPYRRLHVATLGGR